MNDDRVQRIMAGEEGAGRQPVDIDIEAEHTGTERPEGAHGALHVILETAEYVSDRATHLSVNAVEGVKAAETLSAVARQIRTLSSNTSLEASRLGGSATVAEIARQMRLLSQQVTALSEHLTSCLRSQNVALGELGGAVDALLADTATTQALLARGQAQAYPGEAPRGLPRVPESALETPVNG